MARSDRVRFSFTLPRKGGQPWVSGSWRVWTHRDTVYIADKQVPAWKVSLHGEEAWRLAVAKEAMEGAASPLPRDHDRAPWTFKPPPFVDGMRRAFVIATARGSFHPGRELDPRDYAILVPDRWDRLAFASVWVSEPGVVGPDHAISPPLRLARGERVWVTSGYQAITAQSPRPTPISSMIHPMTPEKDGTDCPGVLVVGVHLG